MDLQCIGIILRKTDYGDSDIILSCLTEANTIKSFIYKGAKKKKNIALLSQLRIVEINAYQYSNTNLANIKSIQSAQNLNNLYTNPVKIALTFFIADFISQLIQKIENTEGRLFEIIKKELIWLDTTNEYTNYPIFWMIFWIDKLGIKPLSSQGEFFDVETARFLNVPPNTTTYFHGGEVYKLSLLIDEDRLSILSAELNKAERKKILEILLSFVQFHIPEFKELKSLEVLQTIMS